MGDKRRSKMKKLSKMHIADVYGQCLKGDADAMSELIDRQQDGRGLRYYPEGRDGPYDDGIVCVRVFLDSNSIFPALTIRSGRPSREVYISQETLDDWGSVIARGIQRSVKVLTSTGISLSEAKAWLNNNETENLTISFDPSEGFTEAVCDIEPYGASSWVLGFDNAVLALADIMDVASELDWSLPDTRKNLKGVAPYLIPDIIDPSDNETE